MATTENYYLFGVIFFGGLLIVILIVLARLGVLSRLKNIKFKISRDGGEGEMTFHPEKRPEQPKEVKPLQPLQDPRKLEGRVRTILENRRHTLRAPPQNWEAEQIKAGFDFLEKNALVNAKRCFDMVMQRNSKSVEAWYGLAQVFERWKDLKSASFSYWEAIRVNSAHHFSVEARKRLEAISNLERQKNDGQIVLRNGPGPASFWFNEVPDGETLARHVVALSNGDGGGVIVIGCDSSTRQPGTTILNGSDVVIEAALFDYITAPSIHELYCSPCGKWIYIKVLRGLNRPYRVRVAEKDTIFVIDGNGEVRQANKKEEKDLRQNKRN